MSKPTGAPKPRAAAPSGARALMVLMVLLLAGAGRGAWAQTPQAGATAPSGPVPCNVLIEGLNQGMAEKKADAFVAAANLHESGHCAERNDARAVELLGQGARLGSAAAVRRLARRFALGNGVPQSYANAGGWISGKGGTDEPLQPWDYSIGYAYAVLSEVIVRVAFPAEAFGNVAEARFVIEVDARHPGALQMRPTAEDAAKHPQLYAALRAALEKPLPGIIARLASPERPLITAARVAIPVAVRTPLPGAVHVLEDAPILR